MSNGEKVNDKKKRNNIVFQKGFTFKYVSNKKSDGSHHPIFYPA
jgi:hypothetical protein